MLGDFVPLYDAEGTVIGTFDTSTGEGTAYNALDSALATDLAAQWRSVGFNMQAPGFGVTRPDVIDFVGSALPDQPATFADAAKIFRNAAGAMFQYKKMTDPQTGAQIYRAMPYQQSSISPLMLAAIAGAAILLLR